MYWVLLESTMKFICVFLSLQAKIINFPCLQSLQLFKYNRLIMTVALINSFWHSKLFKSVYKQNVSVKSWGVSLRCLPRGVRHFFSVRGSEFRQITSAIVFIGTILSLCLHKRWLEIAVTYANKGYQSPICYSS